MTTGTVLVDGVAGNVTPCTLPVVVTRVPPVVVSPVRSPFVIEIALENLVRLPEAGVPLTLGSPPPPEPSAVPLIHKDCALSDPEPLLPPEAGPIRALLYVGLGQSVGEPGHAA